MCKRGFPYSNDHDFNLDWIIQKALILLISRT